MNQESVIRNSADEEQVRQGRGKVDRIRDRELNDLRFILSSKEGRRVFWRIMGHCRTFGSVWEPSAKIHYNAGQQDIGHFLLAEIHEAGDDFYQQMKTEAKRTTE